MSRISIQVVSKAGEVLAKEEGRNEANLVYKAEYAEGDKILVEVEQVDTFYHVRFDESKGSSLVYLTGPVTYEIPFGASRLSPNGFQGSRHILSVRKAFPEEKRNYRNLAENVWDQADSVNCYPHATANAILPGRPLFAAQSVIDGLTFTKKHGSWPYSSWSICKREDAVWKLEFGREVETDRLVVYTRADYPHDSWWTQMTVAFSDGSREVLPLEKTGSAQVFRITKQTRWLEIRELIKGEDPSPFPALTQLQVFGRG